MDYPNQKSGHKSIVSASLSLLSVVIGTKKNLREKRWNDLHNYIKLAEMTIYKGFPSFF